MNHVDTHWDWFIPKLNLLMMNPNTLHILLKTLLLDRGGPCRDETRQHPNLITALVDSLHLIKISDGRVGSHTVQTKGSVDPVWWFHKGQVRKHLFAAGESFAYGTRDLGCRLFIRGCFQICESVLNCSWLFSSRDLISLYLSGKRGWTTSQAGRCSERGSAGHFRRETDGSLRLIMMFGHVLSVKMWKCMEGSARVRSCAHFQPTQGQTGNSGGTREMLFSPCALSFKSLLIFSILS